MPPKKRPAEEGGNSDDPRKRTTPAAAATPAKSVIASTSGALGAAKPVVKPAPPVTPKAGPVRAPPKPGIRKVGPALANRVKLPAPPVSTVKREAPPPVVTKNTLVWFRNDLRLYDNKALHAASVRAKIGDKRNVVGLFIISEKEWEDHNEAPVKIDFWMRNLAVLKESLGKLNIPLLIKKATSRPDVVKIVESVVKELDISHVFWNTEYMVDEKTRDTDVKNTLTKLPGVYVEELEDQCVIPPKAMISKTGRAFEDFRSFHTAWCNTVEINPHYLELLPVPEANPPEAKQTYAEHLSAAVISSHTHSLDRGEIEKLYPAGEEAALEKLKEFIHSKLMKYDRIRDSPQEHNPLLSPYLSNGILSFRQCVAAARTANKNKILVGNEGVRAFIKEIVWKEFYRHVLVFFPRVCMDHAFKPNTEKIRWSNDDRRFQMWCQGKTGYPLIDAGMRQLKATGFMHAKVRVYVACFLIKDLLINWQKGEAYFMKNLIDGDFASNNGGWQWCASTGVEAQPYFRSFNPIQESQRFDPEGHYIRQWVPELNNLTAKQVHDPYHTLHGKEFGKLA
ncbi:MAG: DNA photolyase, FAD-binding/Cryptochrome [Benniella sp.]|nr:MAG: DNA photolyase, FAD-binding/Cryptochrome [Benniella sp.]